VTGFLVENEEQAVAAVHRLRQLDRRKVRSRFEERFSATRMVNFSATRMVKEYESQYRKLAAAVAPQESTRFDIQRLDT